jgi:hypothetical protein
MWQSLPLAPAPAYGWVAVTPTNMYVAIATACTRTGIRMGSRYPYQCVCGNCHCLHLLWLPNRIKHKLRYITDIFLQFTVNCTQKNVFQVASKWNQGIGHWFLNGRPFKAATLVAVLNELFFRRFFIALQQFFSLFPIACLVVLLFAYLLVVGH